MLHKIGDRVKVFQSSRLSKDTPSRTAIVRDYKWNLVYVEFCDGETEREWVDCRLIKSMDSITDDSRTA